MIIAFSGTDGAGKSTQIELLHAALETQGVKPRTIWARGGYTPIMLRMKGVFLWIIGRKGSSQTLQAAGATDYQAKRKRLLQRGFIARIWLAFAIIDLALLYGVYVRFLSWRGAVILCDRYVGDTKIDFLRNFPKQFKPAGFLWRSLIWSAPAPSLHIILTVSPEVSLRRSQQKNEPFPDSAETLAFRLALYRADTEFTLSEVLRIDGSGPKADIAAKISRSDAVSRLLQAAS